MSLEYCLVDNKLTTDDNNCMARVQNVKTFGIKEITAKITGRGMSITDTEVMSVLNELSYAINSILQDGNAVSTPFVNIRPSIGGVFTNDEDVFDSSRHTIRLNTRLGTDITIDASKIKTRKVAPKTNRPSIKQVTDYQTQRIDEVLTRNAAVELKGYYMKVDPNDQEQGVFIKTDKQEVRAHTYMLNKPSHIIFIVPQDAPEGEVQLVLKSKYRSGSCLRTVVFSKKLKLQ